MHEEEDPAEGRTPAPGEPQARPDAPAPARPRGRRRRWVALVLAPLLGLAGVELGVRWLLFGDGDLAAEWGADLRDAGLYADPDLEGEYWRLARVLRGNPDDGMPNRPHPDLGWVSMWIDPATLVHDDEAGLGDRRPVLLFGASFAQCAPKGDDCFEHWMERSDLAGTHAVINFGVGGYGADQGLLLMREVLPRFEGRDPVVVVAFVIDSDYDRCMVPFRGAPKPRLRVRGGRLEVERHGLGTSAHGYVAAEGTGISSYAWRALLNGATFLPRSWREAWSGRAALRRESAQLKRAVMQALHEELEAAGLEHFFLLVTGPRALHSGHRHPSVRHFEAVAAALDLPCVDPRPALREAQGAGGPALYQTEGKSRNHPTPEGNRVLFEALREGVLGRRDAIEPPRPGSGAGGGASAGDGSAEPAPAPGEAPDAGPELAGPGD